MRNRSNFFFGHCIAAFSSHNSVVSAQAASAKAAKLIDDVGLGEDDVNLSASSWSWRPIAVGSGVSADVLFAVVGVVASGVLPSRKSADTSNASARSSSTPWAIKAN